ncbi:MAG TPA: hypothetical protein VMV86_02605 [Methanosarcinales archaeon]|nr:hypothetical protein [Methanosarcinales archaeon]
MQCRQISNLTMKYFDGNISEIELEQLLKHNQKCSDCAAEFEVMKDAIYEIEALPEIDPPLELTANIMTSITAQKHFNLNTRQLICAVMGFIGLVLFTYNIIAYVILPMIGITPLVSFQSGLEVIYILVEKAKDSFVNMSLYLGKLLIFRNILFREYTVFISLWLGTFAMVGLLLYKLINMKNKNGFVDLK